MTHKELKKFWKKAAKNLEKKWDREKIIVYATAYAMFQEIPFDDFPPQLYNIKMNGGEMKKSMSSLYQKYIEDNEPYSILQDFRAGNISFKEGGMIDFKKMFFKNWDEVVNELKNSNIETYQFALMLTSALALTGNIFEFEPVDEIAPDSANEKEKIKKEFEDFASDGDPMKKLNSDNKNNTYIIVGAAVVGIVVLWIIFKNMK